MWFGCSLYSTFWGEKSVMKQKIKLSFFSCKIPCFLHLFLLFYGLLLRAILKSTWKSVKSQYNSEKLKLFFFTLYIENMWMKTSVKLLFCTVYIYCIAVILYVFIQFIVSWFWHKQKTCVVNQRTTSVYNQTHKTQSKL